MATKVSLGDRFSGCLLGLAVGDALGGHFEAQDPEWIRARYPAPADLIANPPSAPWHYTDDTQMAIGVAEALLKDGAIVERSLCEAFVSNYDASRGYGRGARIILEALREGQDYKHWTNELFPGGSYGNGAAMRVAPVGLFFHDDLDRVWEQARLSSLPTHVHPLGIEGAQLVATAVALCARGSGMDKTRLLDELRGRCKTDEFRSRLDQAASAQTPDDLLPMGNGIAAQDSAATAIACFALWSHSYEQTIANAILLGGDTDTIAAMAGGISGAHLGAAAIPDRFLHCLEDDQKGRSYIRGLAQRLYAAREAVE